MSDEDSFIASPSLPDPRRLTQVISKENIPLIDSPATDANLTPTSRPRTPIPEDLCGKVKGMTEEQVREFLHKMNISEDDSSEEEEEMCELDVHTDKGKHHVKTQKIKNKAATNTQTMKEVLKRKPKNGKAVQTVQNMEKVELESDPEVPISEVKTKISKKGIKKDVKAIAKVAPLRPTNIDDLSNNKTSNEEFYQESKLKKPRGKQNPPREENITNQPELLSNEKQIESGYGDENKSPISNVKNKKKLKKIEFTENDGVQENKAAKKKETHQVLPEETKNVKKNMVKPSRNVPKDTLNVEKVSAIQETTNTKEVSQSKSTRGTRGKQKNTETVVKVTNDLVEGLSLNNKNDQTKPAHEDDTTKPKVGRAKKIVKSTTDSSADTLSNEPELVKEVIEKPKKKQNNTKEKHVEEQVEDPVEVNVPKSKAKPKAAAPAKEKKVLENTKNKNAPEEPTVTKRVTRKK